MKPENSMLSITLHIPITADVDVDDILDALRGQLADALSEIKGQDDSHDEHEAQPTEFRASIEKTEPLSDDTTEDQLSILGYRN